MRLAICCFFACVLISPLLSMAKIPSDMDINIIDYGIYSSGVIDTVRADNPLGHINKTRDIELISSTNRIPAMVGTRFGFRYEVRKRTGKKIVKLLRVIKTPLIKNPNNGRSTEIFKDIIDVAVNYKTFSGYLFEYEWELVPGEYVIQIFNDDKLIAEKTFYIYKP